MQDGGETSTGKGVGREGETVEEGVGRVQDGGETRGGKGGRDCRGGGGEGCRMEERQPVAEYR